MPRFYFHVRNGGQQSYTDKFGEELADARAVWALAATYAGETVRDLGGKLKPEKDWRLEVTNEGGHRVCSILLRTELDKK